MVEQRALFEWSPEVALSLGQKYCNWIVIEDESEYKDSVLLPAPTKSESILMSLKKSLIDTGKSRHPFGESFSKYYQESDELPQVLIDES